MPGGRPPVDVKKRFLEKVKIVESGCHEWVSVLNRGGYGKFYFCGKQEPAHRVAYILFKDLIPANSWVLHKCDNRKCVNPDHLFLGNSQANVKDMDTKGRRGTKSDLTNAQVEDIKNLLAEGRIIPAHFIPTYSQAEIAKMFNVHQGTISRIKLGKSTLFKK